MLFMVVERFSPGRMTEVYEVIRERGRLLPDGLIYVDSWVGAALDVSFQLMECEDPALFQEWVAQWGDLANVEIIPVTTSQVTAELMERLSNQ